jgi:hypothetical protein
MAIALTGVLLLIHRMERTPHLRRAAGVGVAMAILPMAALVGAGDGAGVLGLAVVRAVIVSLGVIAASVGVFRLGSVRASYQD